jgi:hypothetical protein
VKTKVIKAETGLGTEIGIGIGIGIGTGGPRQKAAG